MTEKKVEKFKKWFEVGKESFKECLKYGAILGIAQTALALLNSAVFIWLGLFEPVLLAENDTVTQTLMEGSNFNPTNFILTSLVLAVVSFAVTFAIIFFFGLKKILQTFPEENKIYLGLYIFGVNLAVFFILSSLIASQLNKPQGLIAQVLAAALAIKLAKSKTNLKEGIK